jgi:biopolymer transport protein ExbB
MNHWFLLQGEAAAGRINTDLGSLFDVLTQGGLLMAPILLCSVLVVAYALERLMALRRGRILPGSLLTGLHDALGRRDLHRAQSLCETDGSPLASIALAGIRRMNTSSLPEVEKTMEDAGLREVSRLKKNVRPLSVVAGVAPLLGLLGTVFGMIEAFNVVADAGLGKQELLASGIAKALVTTGAGLSVAIPAFFLYHFFMGRIARFVLELDEACVSLLDAVPGAGAESEIVS